MTRKIVVEKEEWNDEKNRYRYAAELESGNLLFFPTIPFEISQEELLFVKSDSKNYTKQTTSFLEKLLAPYAESWIPEKARWITRPKTNVSLETFQDDPVHGERILRFYTNFDSDLSYQWMTSHSFHDLTSMFGGKQIAFPRTPSSSFLHRFARKTKKVVHHLGMKLSLQSPYDVFMARLEHFLMRNEQFQKSCRKDRWTFPPFSCWAIYTDLVAHAALSYHHILEQTFIIPQRALLFPEKSPLGILERITQSNLVIHEYIKKT